MMRQRSSKSIQKSDVKIKFCKRRFYIIELIISITPRPNVWKDIGSYQPTIPSSFPSRLNSGSKKFYMKYEKQLVIGAFQRLDCSLLQQKISNLKLSTLREANSVLKVQKFSPKLFNRGPNNLDDSHCLAFSDTSHGKGSYVQTGYISGVSFHSSSEIVFHPIDWQISRQSRVSFS